MLKRPLQPFHPKFEARCTPPAAWLRTPWVSWLCCGKPGQCWDLTMGWDVAPLYGYPPLFCVISAGDISHVRTHHQLVRLYNKNGPFVDIHTRTRAHASRPSMRTYKPTRMHTLFWCPSSPQCSPPNVPRESPSYVV